ncbi:MULTISPECIES: hypothetical protein [unclassified Ketobacter]|uniref:hypothetical protein n=1 Tax=unclassified Ketobacter TaxID=2639109 RepID=UPI000F179335|nr:MULTISPECIES: hypothetical protein [unclassified Ketobacter]RLT87362.1 MAG: hypothetical protein D9N13_23335 [Ketobacter sp. GenoA1]RLT94312.1 MAG: hypothetical protein D9N15_17925 [Ketobacter sp.]
MRTLPAMAILMLLAQPVAAQPLCDDVEAFSADGWQLDPVQDAMDKYLRDHRMRANWRQQPAPPDQIGRDYYEWLWHSDFGAIMKAELMQRFCGSASEPVP